MRYSIVVAVAALSALALSACDKQPAVAPAPPVIVTVPGPQGVAGAPAERGATGATGDTGMTGEQGKKGEQGEGTILVVPAR